MPAGAAQPLQMSQGEALTLRVPVVDAEGAPASLTGSSVAFVVAASLGAPPALSKTTAGGGVTLATTAAANDTVVVALGPADTAELRGRYVYEVALTGDDGAVLAWGELEIAPSSAL